MKRTFIAFVLLTVAAAAACSHQQHHGYDPGESSKLVKSLTEAEVANYIEGRGMGLAKPAELNSYPGPMHVLELADKLSLTAEQRGETQRIFDAMRAEATRLGKLIVEKEGELNRAFTNGSISRESLATRVTELSRLQGELRALHLGAHIEMQQVLSAEQVKTYDELRGYRKSGS